MWFNLFIQKSRFGMCWIYGVINGILVAPIYIKDEQALEDYIIGK